MGQQGRKSKGKGTSILLSFPLPPVNMQALRALLKLFKFPAICHLSEALSFFLWPGSDAQ